MNKYRVKFELLGKAGSCTVKATNPDNACQILRAKLMIKEITPVSSPVDDLFKMFGWSNQGKPFV